MESQEFKMLEYLGNFTGPHWNMEEFEKLFKTTAFAAELVDKLNQKGYTYAKKEGERFMLGYHPQAILTDKGKNYLKSNKLKRWLIENSSNAIVWANLITLFTFSLGLILNALINMDKIYINFDKYIKFW